MHYMTLFEEATFIVVWYIHSDIMLRRRDLTVTGNIGEVLRLFFCRDRLSSIGPRSERQVPLIYLPRRFLIAGGKMRSCMSVSWDNEKS